MSDFDKFIADKLEEEGDFPHRDRNWKQLAQRLQAFEIGGSGKPSPWHYWPAAAAMVVSLSVAGWLLWKMQVVQQENATLRQEIDSLRQALPTVAPIATLPPENIPDSAGTEKSTNPPKEYLPPSTASARPYPQQRQADGSAANISRTTPRFPNRKQQNKIFDQWATPPDITLNTTVDAHLIPAKIIDAVANKIPDTLSILANEKEKKVIAIAGIPLSTVQPDSSCLTISIPPLDSTRAVLAETAPPLLPVAAPDSVAMAAIPPPIIQPLRPHYRFRLGVEGVAGTSLPHEQGVSALLGSGIVAAYAPWRFLQLQASADWLHFDVNTAHYVPRFHAPRHLPPMHSQGHDELVQVESQQRQQHFALGLTYALPVRGWLRPVVRVAHTWVHVAPGLVSFKFEEQHGGPGPGPGPGPGHHDPEYIVKKFEGQTLSNIWRIGVGLEHELPRWTFGLWADYSKNLAASESTFDALLVRGGMQYKF